MDKLQYTSGQRVLGQRPSGHFTNYWEETVFIHEIANGSEPKYVCTTPQTKEDYLAGKKFVIKRYYSIKPIPEKPVKPQGFAILTGIVDKVLTREVKDININGEDFYLVPKN